MARVSDREIPLLPNYYKESRIPGVRFTVIFVGDLAYLGTMEVLTHVVMNVIDLKPCKIGIFVDANGSVKCDDYDYNKEREIGYHYLQTLSQTITLSLYRSTCRSVDAF